MIKSRNWISRRKLKIFQSEMFNQGLYHVVEYKQEANLENG